MSIWGKPAVQHLGGGLTGLGSFPSPCLAAPQGWKAPPFIDSRGYCLPADDQGDEPKCAAYAMAGLVEVYRWRATHIPCTVDPGPIHAEAKRLDGNKEPGTTLVSVFGAAKNLGLLKATADASLFYDFETFLFALHRHTVVLLGFNISAGWNNCNRRTGWIGSGRAGLRGHGVLGCWADGAAGAGWQNSWSARNWGVNGFGKMTKEQFADQFIGGLAVSEEGTP